MFRRFDENIMKNLNINISYFCHEQNFVRSLANIKIFHHHAVLGKIRFSREIVLKRLRECRVRFWNTNCLKVNEDEIIKYGQKRP